MSLISASTAQAPGPQTDCPTPIDGGPVVVDVATASEDRTDQIIIKYRSGASGVAGGLRVPHLAQMSADASDALSGETLSYGRELDNGGHVLKLGNKIGLARMRAITARFAAQADVEYAEPDRIMYPVLTPNDNACAGSWVNVGNVTSRRFASVC